MYPNYMNPYEFSQGYAFNASNDNNSYSQQGMAAVSVKTINEVQLDLYQKQEEAKIQCQKETAIQAERARHEIAVIDYREARLAGRKEYELALENAYFEVIIRDAGPYYYRVIKNQVRKEQLLFPAYGLASYFWNCKDGKEQPRVLEIRDKIHAEPIILVDPEIDTEHLIKGFQKWGLTCRLDVEISKKL